VERIDVKNLNKSDSRLGNYNGVDVENRLLRRLFSP
jgi:hypothetical protein